MLHGQAKLDICISMQQPRLRSMSCHLILFAAVNAVSLISTLFIEILSPLFQPSPLPPFPSPIPISFPLEGKKNKIRILELVCVSVENERK